MRPHLSDRGKRGLLRLLLSAATLLAGLAPLGGARADSPVSAYGTAANLVKNWSFEDDFEGSTASTKVGKDWKAFTVSGSVGFHSGYDLYGATVEKIDGTDSQVLKGDEPFDAGVYQVITGLTPNQWYSVVVFVLSVFETSVTANPSIFDGLIVKQIGVDTFGGANPLAQTVVWSSEYGKNMDRATWGERLTFMAQSSSATLFIRARCTKAVSNKAAFDNQVFIDGAQLRLAAISQATVPQAVQSGSFSVSWKAVVPGAYSTEALVSEYDVDYRDGSGAWVGWLSHTTAASADFTLAQPGDNYTFRVRAWARYNSPFAEIMGPWAESASVQAGQVIELHVLDNRGDPVMDVAAQVLDGSGALAASGVTDGAGRVLLAPPTVGSYDVVVAPTWYQAPPPLHNIEVTAGIQVVEVTLRPPDDVVQDGSFEDGEAGLPPAHWTADGGVVQVSDYAWRSGGQSLRIGTSPRDIGACLRQTYTLDGVYQPALSFWHKLFPGQNGMRRVLQATLYDAEMAVLATTSAQSQEPAEWEWLSLVAGTSDALYYGQLTVEVCLADQPGAPEPTAEETYAHLDDISLGRSGGGPFRAYIPMLYRGQSLSQVSFGHE